MSRTCSNLMQRRGDTGSAIILVLALTAVVVAFGTLLVALGAVAVDRHRAASAADLAALTAARHARYGVGPACLAATKVAAKVNARMVTCSLHGTQAQVEVVVRPSPPLRLIGSARAMARAGPVAEDRGR